MHYNCNLFIVEVLHYYCSFSMFVSVHKTIVLYEINRVNKYLREEFFLLEEMSKASLLPGRASLLLKVFPGMCMIIA